MAEGRIKFIDCSLRDGHQSLLATRMSTEQCMRVLPMLKDSGYDILELWGGATLDSALRYTGDDPFERLDKFRDMLGNPLQGGIAVRALCRGQNLFAYTPYRDNVVFQFLKEAVRSGVGRMRIFDALNDERNLVTATMSTKTFNGHAEAAISYTTSPVHDAQHFLNFAKRAVDNGADSIAIKDMAGLLHPYDAFELIESLRKEFPNLQLTLHSHCTNGLANVSYLVGMMLGVDYLDTCYGPMAAATSQPSIELMQMFAKELGLQTNVEMGNAAKIDEELRKIRKELSAVDKDPEHMGNPWPAEPDQKMRDRVKKTVELVQKRDKDSIEQAMSIIEDELLPEQGYPKIDRAQLGAQIPGGMISNLHNQLKDQGKLEEMPKILEEVPKVRADAGYVPLVTPTSQIVGTQAAFNVLQGSRYTFASQPFKDLLAGKYGRLPGPPNTEVQQKVLAGQEVAMGRPADYAPRVDLEAVYAEHGKIIKSHRDLLLMVLFPAAAKKFLAERNGQASG